MEDGEIIDDEVDLDFCYVPLERPAELLNPVVVAPPVQDADSEPEEEEDSSSDSDSDGNSNHRQSKKPKMKAVKPRPAPQAAASKPKKYDIWCASLQEEVLTRGLNSCDVAPVQRDRSVETYNYRIGRRSVSPEELIEKLQQSSNEPMMSNKRTYADRNRGDVRNRLGWKPRGGFNNPMDRRGTQRQLGELEVSDDCTEEEFAADLTKKLNEEKGELILKIVQVLGKEKSKEIYNMTKNIEAGGGMLIMNQTRRRTSGGVFLFHVRNSCNSDECTEIFDENRRQHEKIRRDQRAVKRREIARANQALNANKTVNATGDDAEDGEIEEGELEMKTDVALSGEEEDPRAQVKDPPPSPVTDGRPDSSPEVHDRRPGNPVGQAARQMTSYDDDLLDLHVDFNEMDDMETF